VGVAGAFIGVAAFVMPGALKATPEQPNEIVEPTDSDHARALRALGVLIGQSEALIAVHGPESGERPRIVLWYADADGDGLVAVGEVLVLSHHPTAGALAAHTFDPALSGDAGADRALLDAELVASRGFAERWALRADVRSSVIVTGLTGVRVEPVSRGPGAGGWRLTLTWPGERADDDSGTKQGPAVPIEDSGSVPINLPAYTPARSAQE
jgi:hypothetical protein